MHARNACLLHGRRALLHANANRSPRRSSRRAAARSCAQTTRWGAAPTATAASSTTTSRYVDWKTVTHGRDTFGWPAIQGVWERSGSWRLLVPPPPACPHASHVLPPLPLPIACPSASLAFPAPRQIRALGHPSAGRQNSNCAAWLVLARLMCRCRCCSTSCGPNPRTFPAAASSATRPAAAPLVSYGACHACHAWWLWLWEGGREAVATWAFLGHAVRPTSPQPPPQLLSVSVRKHPPLPRPASHLTTPPHPRPSVASPTYSPSGSLPSCCACPRTSPTLPSITYRLPTDLHSSPYPGRYHLPLRSQPRQRRRLPQAAPHTASPLRLGSRTRRRRRWRRR